MCSESDSWCILRTCHNHAGPLVPFFVGAHIGYTFGMIRFWQGEKARALKYVTMYPRLIEHALRTELGTYVSVPCAGALAEWLHDDGAGMFTSWGRQAWTILAAQSIIPQVDEIDSLARSSLVSTYVEATAVSDAS